METADVAIIGGGIVGLAVAWQVTQQQPGKKVLVLEKENALARHQTGHNSGVLHSGIYYKPGSLKAENCREGKKAMERFCAEHGIDYDVCGKVIVAVAEDEIPRLERILERGQQNRVKCEMIDAGRLRELEPHAAGVKAIWVPEAGIVNYGQVCRKLADLVQEREGRIETNSRVTAIRHDGQGATLVTSKGDFQAACVVNCAGLHCDRVTRMGGTEPEAKIVPFRGEYYKLKPEAYQLCRNLIYPVPDPSFPFLGVHFTRMIEGGVECGPNAVLAFAREGYRKTDINLRDLCESLGYSGFRKLAARYWRTGMGEMWRSLSKGAFVRALRRLIPEIRREHLVPGGAGVRAQAVTPEGDMVDDFLIVDGERIINVNNAPSPAATSSLNIGRLIAEKVAARWE